MALTLRKAATLAVFVAAVALLLPLIQTTLAAAPTPVTAAEAAATVARRLQASNVTQYRTTAALACSRSTIAGFAKKVILKPGLLFHWKVIRGSILRAGIVATASSGAKNGWISVAWTKSPGRMYPADAVVANLPSPATVKAYTMTGYSSSTVKPTSVFSVSATTVARKSQATVIRFTRTGKSGVAPVNYAGANNIVWAYSDSGSRTLGFHGSNEGSATIDFACKV